MKYNLYGYSQQKAIELGLDDRDLMILRWFIDYKDTGKMAKKIINDDVYYWIKYEGIVEAFPIAGWKKDTVYRRLKKLVNAKVLKHETIKQCGVWSYYTVGENYIELLDSNGKSTVDIIEEPFGNKSEVNGNKSEGIGKKSEVNGNKSRTKYSSINNSSINNLNKKEKGNTEIDDLIESYTDNKELTDTLYEFIKFRKEIKKPMTTQAVKLMLNKLNKLSNNDSIKIEILNQSILNGWTGIFELKNGYNRNITNNNNCNSTETKGEIKFGVKSDYIVY